MTRHYFNFMHEIEGGRPPVPGKVGAMLSTADGWANSFSVWPWARAYAERRVREMFDLPAGPGDLEARVMRKYRDNVRRRTRAQFEAARVAAP